MKMNSIVRTAAVLCAAVSLQAASASVVPIGPFTGDYFENFQDHATGQFLPSLDVFEDRAVVKQLGPGQGLHVTTGWGFFGMVVPHSGTKFMGGAGVNAEWEFDVPAQRFGGYFSTNADVPGATAIFFDEDGNQIGSHPVKARIDGDWQWDGWETTGAGIKRVQIIASNQWGGFIMHDSMEYTPMGDVPACPGDLTGNGSVGVPDLLQLLSCWGPVQPGCESADLTGNGSVGVPDLLELLANWGPCPEATGACCVDETCSEQTEDDCNNLGGTYLGNNVSCDPNPCEACGPNAGDCCNANPTPGCNDIECCELICSQDPFCCDFEWDGQCAGMAQNQCAVCQ